MAVRFLRDNYILSASMLTPTSTRNGQVGRAVKVGAGSATMAASGAYTGTDPQQFIVYIDSVAGGSEIGQATFKWRIATSGTWYGPYTTTTGTLELTSGVYVSWTSGSGQDCYVGDWWSVIVDRAYGSRMLLDADRDTEWRSTTVGATVGLDIDFGAAVAPDVVALVDHNLTATASLSIVANSSAVWTSPPLNETITYHADNVVHYLTTSPRVYRYWRVYLTNTANTDGYLRAAELYLGAYSTLTRAPQYRFTRTKTAATYGPTGALRLPRGVWAQAELVDLSYRLMASADRDEALAIFDYLYDHEEGVVRPILVHVDSTDAGDVSVYEIEAHELPVVWDVGTRFDFPLRLRQRPRITRSGP